MNKRTYSVCKVKSIHCNQFLILYTSCLSKFPGTEREVNLCLGTQLESVVISFFHPRFPSPIFVTLLPDATVCSTAASWVPPTSLLNTGLVFWPWKTEVSTKAWWEHPQMPGCHSPLPPTKHCFIQHTCLLLKLGEPDMGFLGEATFDGKQRALATKHLVVLSTWTVNTFQSSSANYKHFQSRGASGYGRTNCSIWKQGSKYRG